MTKSPGEKITDLKVELIGYDGNVFAIIGKVGTALKRNGYEHLVNHFNKACFSAESYNDVLNIVDQYVEVA